MSHATRLRTCRSAEGGRQAANDALDRWDEQLALAGRGARLAVSERGTDGRYTDGGGA